MLPKRYLFALGVLALASLACGITFKLPVDQIETGPDVEEPILIPAPEAEIVDLTLAFGAGKLKVQPGADDALVSGAVLYNVPELKPEITVEENTVRMESGDLQIQGIPKFDDNVKNEWDLKLGDMPLNLIIQAGAYRGRLELGGLSLKSLEVNDGAADAKIEFSDPNLVEMSTLRYASGASKVELIGLANANFTSMLFRSGAGDYRLDFSGELQREATVTIESGVSHVVLVVPEDTPARVIFSGGLTNVQTSGAWHKSGGAYVLGSGEPLLTIHVEMGAGSLELRTR